MTYNNENAMMETKRISFCPLWSRTTVSPWMYPRITRASFELPTCEDSWRRQPAV